MYRAAADQILSLQITAVIEGVEKLRASSQLKHPKKHQELIQRLATIRAMLDLGAITLKESARGWPGEPDYRE